MQECCKSCDKTLKLMFLPFFSLDIIYLPHIHKNQTTRRKELVCHLRVKTYIRYYIAQFARLHIPHVTRKLTVYVFFTSFKTGKRQSVKKLIKYIQKFFKFFFCLCDVPKLVYRLCDFISEEISSNNHLYRVC